MARRVTGIILAGGDSRRFGSEKAFASWNGRPFLRCVSEAIQGVCDVQILLVPFQADARPYAQLVPGATILPDVKPRAGPVDALRGALDLVRTPTVLVAPCDAPGLPTGLARRLVAMCEENHKPTVAQSVAGPVWTIFAVPRDLLMARAPTAHRMEDLLDGAEMVETDAEGLNVNEPPR